jgi:uncharacterized membrane protein
VVKTGGGARNRGVGRIHGGLIGGVLGLLSLALSQSAAAAPACDGDFSERVYSAIAGPDFRLSMLTVLSPFPLFVGIVLVLHKRFSGRRQALPAARRMYERRASTEPTRPLLRSANDTNRGPLVAAATLLGIGLGGFVDSIVFHQLLQLHNVLRQTLPPSSALHADANLLWDGIFHTLTFAITAAGLGMLWHATGRREVPHATHLFVGGMVLGWGLFNSVEGVRILGLHHVLESDTHLLWDGLYLASGLLMMALGWVLIRANGQMQLRAGQSMARL